MSRIRTFIAAEIPEHIRRRGAELIGHLQAAGANVKWTEAINLHWTLKFLGDVPLEEIDAVCRATSEAVATLAPFDLHVAGAGAFPSVDQPRTIWLGVEKGGEAMTELVESLDNRLAELGFRAETRRFRPHLTLGRVRDAGPARAELARLLREHADFKAGLMAVDEAVVFSSQLESNGLVYQPLDHAELGAGLDSI